MRKKWILGKVFTSHSSKDKPFVRRIAKRLWKEGYQVWLDEKERVPGDALAARLSDALAQSRVVAVVVTPNSLGSRWLKFELNKAAERMVKGECRLIPILLGDVEPPNELKGVIYADFRSSFRDGVRSVLAALETESTLALRGSWAELPALIEEVFDEEGTTSVMGVYESFSFDFVQLEGLVDVAYSGNDAEIVYDIVHDYLGTKEPISEPWWSEYLAARERYPSSFYLIVSERPVDFSACAVSSNSREIHVFANHSYFVVVVDVSSASEAAQKLEILQAAREEFVDAATNIVRHGTWL